jgi:lysozyme family protein
MAVVEVVLRGQEEKMNFDAAFGKVIDHEGGYVNHANDPGGETKYGISKRSYPHLDIPNLTLADAKVIYKRDYWGPAGCDAVPDAMKFQLFDLAVNSGVARAVRILQAAAGVDTDGILGPNTLAAVMAAHPARLVARFNGHRLKFLTTLPGWETFGRGWARRVADNLLES